MKSEKKQLTGYASIDKPWLKYYPDEAIDAQLPECTVYEYILEQNKSNLDDVAIVFFDTTITYRELFENIDKVALALQKQDVHKGEVVTICVPNTPEAVYIFYGINKVGAICDFLDPRASELVMKEHLNVANTRLLISIPEKYDDFKRIQTDTKIEKIITVSALQTLTVKPQPIESNDMLWDDFISSGLYETFSGSSNTVSSPVCILHTGGTTGSPKGAVLNSLNFHSLVVQWKYLGLYYQRNSTLLSLMPPFVSFGLTANLHVPLSFGMQLILIPEYNPERTVDLIKKYKPNCVPASPAHWESVYHNPQIEKIDFSFLKVAYIGGDTLSTRIEQGLNDIFSKSNSNLRIMKAYGMTELTTAVSFTFSALTNQKNSVGAPLPQTTVGIFNDAEQELRYNEIGEICVQSKSMMCGYYNNQLETDATIRTHPDGSKWLHTGDLGEISSDGTLFIKGRIKRIIIRYDGIKVYPVDVENKILENPLVQSCAVVAMKDPDHIQGSLPVAFVVLKDNVNSVEQQSIIRRYCVDNIIDYAVPSKYFFVSSLPKTNNGKLDFILLETEVNSQN